MSQRAFGGVHTERKLSILTHYLGMYQKALKSKGFHTHYIDAFAGSGEIPAAQEENYLFDEDATLVMRGSASRALEVKPAFDRYTFIDARKACIDKLRTRFQGERLFDRISFRCCDANDAIHQLCEGLRGPSQRAAFFLDPFGNQVAWESIKAIASTKKADLWYLFPAGVGVFRQISRQGKFDATKETSITRMFGTEDWKQAFLQPSGQGELFGGDTGAEKAVTPESAARFMIERMKGCFAGGVLDEMLPLGKHSYPSFYLIFAWANPSEAASALARRLAKAAIKASDRVNGRLV